MTTSLTIALAQLNPVVGDVAGNANLLLAARHEAARGGADLVVYSELVLIGYPPEDLVLKSRDGATRSGWLRNAMGELTERERTIIVQRRLSEDVSTLGTLGVELGISKERVRQIEQKALEKIKVSMHRQLNERPTERPVIG